MVVRSLGHPCATRARDARDEGGGIGGFEVQPVYPLALDDEATGIRTLPFLSDEFLEALRFVSDKARELGLRVDLTLGSGWPFGGPGVPIAAASGKLRVERREVSPGERAVTVPDLAAGERLIAVFLEQGPAGSTPPRRSRLVLPADCCVPIPAGATGPLRLQFFIASRTGMQVKRAAIGGEGFVLDHYDRKALDGYLRVVGDRLMSAFRGRPPFAVFCDSLEAYEGDWTGDLLDEFRAPPRLRSRAPPARPRGRRHTRVGGRSPRLGPHADRAGERALSRTAARVGDPRWDTPARAGVWDPSGSLSSNALVDISDGEGVQWTRLTASRWASSAAHLFDRDVASSETWTWLHSPAFRAGPLDMKVEADRHFLQGINQLVGHGWPYTPPGVDEPGWRFYAAGVFNDRNPWWIVMPDLTGYLQRVGFLLRQGDPVADVAVYLPTSDAWAHFTPGQVNLFDTLRDRLGPDLLGTISAAGYGFESVRR